MTPMSPPQGAPQKKSTMTVLIIVLIGGGLAMVCCMGMLAAIAIPNFIKFQARSKQAEVKSNLKAAYVAERSYLGEKETFSEDFGEVGFSPGPGNRYLYLVSQKGAHGITAADPKLAAGATVAGYVAAIPPGVLAEAGTHGKCPDDCYVTVIGVGNIDNDAALDVWSISTQARTFGGVAVPAGQPFMHVNDLEN